ncbi:MAG: response regulator [Nitrospirae bacterium]|nr:response regulator [Nitrospirota bacterium]
MRILAVYDGTLNSKDVVRYGLFRAKTTGGELHVIHVLDSALITEYAGFNAEETARRELSYYLSDAEKIIAEVGKGIRVSFTTMDGIPVDEFVRYAKENKIEMILIPEKYAEIGRHAPCPVSIVPSDFSTFKILLVDDEVEFVNSLAKRLNLRNLKTDVATSGEETIAFVNREKPDIMILDLRMPGMDGIEVLRRVKQSSPAMQVIMLSGRETKGDREEAAKLGAFDFVSKPADIDMLAGKIKEAYWTKIEKPQQISAL